MPASTAPMAAPSGSGPHDPLVSVPLLLFGAFGGPAAWVSQLIINYGFASFSCYPRYFPRTHVVPGWGGIWGTLLGINCAALLLALIATVVSFRTWSKTRRAPSGLSGEALPIGEGITRFFGAVGLMTGLGFFAAVAFDTIALFLVPQCIG